MNTFNAAFDMPATAEQAIAVLERWGEPLTMTFSAERAKQCARLLRDAWHGKSKDASVSAVLAEVDRAVAKFPTWPTDPLHALGVLHEEVGELSKAVLQQVYEPWKNKAADVRDEAVQAAAMALRFAASLDTYVYSKSEQHEQ